MIQDQGPLLLDQICLRSLLDAGQAKLAHFAGLVSDNNILTPSAAWRMKLNACGKYSDELCLRVAQELVGSQGLPPPPPIASLSKNAQAMHLTERKSSIRRQGNSVAHQLVNGSVLREIIGRSVSGDLECSGVLGVLEFVENG